MDILIVRRRNNGWIAYFESKPETWEFGRSQQEAIGKLLLATGGWSIGFHIEVK